LETVKDFVLITNRKSHTGFQVQLAHQLATSNDLELSNLMAVILHHFTQSGSFQNQLC